MAALLRAGSLDSVRGTGVGKRAGQGFGAVRCHSAADGVRPRGKEERLVLGAPLDFLMGRGSIIVQD